MVKAKSKENWLLVEKHNKDELNLKIHMDGNSPRRFRKTYVLIRIKVTT